MYHTQQHKSKKSCPNSLAPFSSMKTHLHAHQSANGLCSAFVNSLTFLSLTKTKKKNEKILVFT